MIPGGARVRTIGAGRVDPRGEYVLYWIQAFRRLDHNHALDVALRLAAGLGKPLVVYEGLRLDYPHASRRLHRFVLDGMAANLRAAEALGLAYWPFVQQHADDGRGLVHRLASRAAAVVTDDWPAFVVPAQTAALSARSAAAVFAVDGSSVVPLSVLGPAVSAAAHLRPRIHRAFPEWWPQRAAARPRVPDAARADLSPPFEPWDGEDAGALLDRLPLDPLAAVPGRAGGSDAGRAALRRFVREGLTGYADGRSRPGPPGASHASALSPFLHFGHLSIEEVVSAVLGDEATLDPAARGRREGFWSADADACAFLDQAITWRDVGLHWHWHRGGDAARLEAALPSWALQTLQSHARDPRSHVYTLEEWDAGATHDPLWNAAQRELVATGTIHGYMRMLWGKKVLEWSRRPTEAYRTLEHLNNRYALDGRDPNSYSGILWCFGLFDRPWAPERPVYGRVRYMSSENTARKFRMGPYLDYVASLPAQSSSPATNQASPIRSRNSL